MGLLDDAIREHLELKRKHGAESGRRRAPGAGGARAGPAQRVRADRNRAGGRGERARGRAGDPEPAAPEEAPAPPLNEDEAPEEPAQPEPGYEEDPWLDDERDEVPADEALEPPPSRRGDEDVLEETPDFLQETPEHDRLWFEQKPPRDFDWDK